MKLMYNVQIMLIYVKTNVVLCGVVFMTRSAFQQAYLTADTTHFLLKWIYTFSCCLLSPKNIRHRLHNQYFCTNELKSTKLIDWVSVLWSYCSSFWIALLGVVQMRFSLARQVLSRHAQLYMVSLFWICIFFSVCVHFNKCLMIRIYCKMQKCII